MSLPLYVFRTSDLINDMANSELRSKRRGDKYTGLFKLHAVETSHQERTRTHGLEKRNQSRGCAAALQKLLRRGLISAKQELSADRTGICSIRKFLYQLNANG